MGKRRTKRQKSSLVTVLILIVIAVMCVIFIKDQILSSNETYADRDSLFNLTNAGDVVIVIDGNVEGTLGLSEGGDYYLPYGFVWDEINGAFYVEEAADTLYMTLQDQTLTWSIDDGSNNLIKDDEGTYYISADCVEEYSYIELETYTDPNRIVIETLSEDAEYVSVTEETYIRTGATRKATIVCEGNVGAVLQLLTPDEKWSYVMTEDGLFGYIPNDCIDETIVAERVIDKPELEFESIEFGETIKMAWDYIGDATANANLGSKISEATDLNIISPTWFYIGDTDGNLISYAEASYVENAKNNYGLSVWALVGGYVGDDSTTGAILQSYENRQRIITQLIEEALACGIEGINIDFEDIAEAYAPAYVEFLRELTQQAHMNNLIVSVDNYVPGYTDYYRRDMQNQVVDYIIMMGYDEHTAYTEDYGSVASITYVEEGLAATLEEVDPQKLVLGVPFYTRGWKVPFGSDAFEAFTVIMSEQQSFMEEYGITELTWDSSVGQYVGSSEDDTGRYYIWIEDTESLSEKLSLVNEYSLAGASAWRLGMETEDIWSVWNERLG